jgi:hypothetical protein
LPYEQRTVDIYTYYSVFSKDQLRTNKIDRNIITTDDSETSDEKVYYVSMKKDKINREILKVMKASAVDCELNKGENMEDDEKNQFQCFQVNGKNTQYLFDPNLEVDRIITTIELKEMKPDRERVVAKALNAEPAAAASSIVERVKVVRIKDQEYLIRVKPNSSGTIFQLFHRNDVEFKRAKGEITKDPVLGKYTAFRLYVSEESS